MRVRFLAHVFDCIGESLCLAQQFKVTRLWPANCPTTTEILVIAQKKIIGLLCSAFVCRCRCRRLEMQNKPKRISRVRPSLSKDDRRKSERFPIKLEVRYKLSDARNISGAGKTVNMSGRGVLFTTESRLSEKQSIELAVNWPAKLNDAIPLQLVALGHIV